MKTIIWTCQSQTRLGFTPGMRIMVAVQKSGKPTSADGLYAACAADLDVDDDFDLSLAKYDWLHRGV